MITRKVILSSVALLTCVGLAYEETVAQDALQKYAQQCYDAIGIDVPGFNCNDDEKFTEVPVDNLTGEGENGICDRPNVLNSECDKGSRFWVIRDKSKPKSFAVAHCRKRGSPGKLFSDIAVIQHNQTTGATCFYQALTDDQTFGHGDLRGEEVKAPSEGLSAWQWFTPDKTARTACVGCHDNGPIIRSPYLSQIRPESPTKNNQLPGAMDMSFNSDSQPYFFIGHDFASWKAFKVEVPGNTCNVCHRMGVNNITGGGTARRFGITATAMSQINKNPHSGTSPIWMVNVDTKHPKQTGDPFNDPVPQANKKAAENIQTCANRFFGFPLAGSDCRITQFAPGMLNDALFFAPDPATYKTVMPEGCPAGFKGKFTFEGSMRVKDLTALELFSDIFIHVETLTDENLILLPIGGAKGAGAIFDPGISDLRPGHPQERVKFNICLKDKPFRPFELFVNVYGKENTLE